MFPVRVICCCWCWLLLPRLVFAFYIFHFFCKHFCNPFLLLETTALVGTKNPRRMTFQHGRIRLFCCRFYVARYSQWQQQLKRFVKQLAQHYERIRARFVEFYCGFFKTLLPAVVCSVSLLFRIWFVAICSCSCRGCCTHHSVLPSYLAL